MDRSDDKIAALMADLEKSDKPTLRKAVDALIPIAADDPQIATTLSELLNDPGRKNRWPVAYILASLPSPTQSSVQVLTETLDHRDPDIRWAVALILIRLAKADRQVLKLLIEARFKRNGQPEKDGDLFSTRCGSNGCRERANTSGFSIRP